MKKSLFALLAPLSLVADPCCELTQDHCYPYAVNPPLLSDSCYTWGVHADLLYLQVYEESNPAAQFLSTNSNPTAPQFGLGLEDYDNDLKAGFRLGVDVGLPCSDLTIGFNWAHYLHNFQSSFSAAANVTPAPGFTVNETSPTGGTVVFSPFSFIPAMTLNNITGSQLTTSWHVHLEDANLIASREFYVGHKMTLRPYGGLRALFLDQKVNILNSFTDSDVDAEFPLSTSTSSLVASFKGIGVVGGLFTSWDFFSNLGLYADFSGALFYGRVKSEYITNFFDGDPDDAINVAAIYNRNTTKATLDFGLGLQWSGYVWNDLGVLTLKAGWEQHIYFDQNTLLSIGRGVQVSGGSRVAQNLTPSLNDNNLTFQGLVVSGSFSF